MSDGPILVVGPPSSGQVAMRESLLLAPGAWRAVGVEDELLGYAAGRGRDLALGDRLPAAAAAAGAEGVHEALAAHRCTLDAAAVPGAAPRLVAAGPALSLSVAFLATVFPDASFVYLHRDPAAAVGDALTEWRSGASVTYPELPGWSGPAWSLPLVPDWSRLAGRPLPEVVVEQWAAIAGLALDDLEALDASRWRLVDTAALVREPEEEVQRLFEHLGLGWHSGCSAPWRALGRASDAPPADTALPESLERVRRRVAAVAPPPVDVPSRAPGGVSATDSGLGAVLKQARSSLLVSTYQSNRVLVLRHDAGALGVHLRTFDRPMGLAVTPGGLAVGTRAEVWDFRDFPAAAADLQPKGRHDACLMPRNAHVTGDIAVHDLEVGRDGLWLVATRFSCLATLDADHSFVPRWRPPFVTALAPEDRCHLNGLALVDGVPRFVTALGTSDTPGGWRERKADGGVVVDVARDEVVLDGLSMPHSPRWHDGRLWLLESGRGRLSVCDLEAGTTRTVAELPGFTRGLRFHGTTAFVATSQIRETATFGGLPISALTRRECGVWAVDVRSGSVLGSVRFGEGVQEVFDVAVLAGVRYPEVAEPSGQLMRDSWFVPSPRGAALPPARD